MNKTARENSKEPAPRGRYNDHIELLRLLRPELLAQKQGTGLDDETYLEAWLAITGHSEYPALGATQLSERLFAPMAGWPVWGRLGMCPLLRYLLTIRNDSRELGDIKSEAALADTLAWFYTRMLPEYGLQEAVDAQTLQALNESVGYFPSQQAASSAAPSAANAPVVPLSILMGLVWRHRDDVQALYDVGTPLGRARYLQWFITHGVNEMNLAPLVSERWRAWLLGGVASSAEGTDGTRLPVILPRLGMLMWYANSDLRQMFDLRTPAGLLGLAEWTRTQLRAEPSWRWLSTQPSVSGRNAVDPVTKPRKDFGVNLIGFARGELGIGEDVRMAAAACDAAGIPHAIVNIAPGTNTRQADRMLDAKLGAKSNREFAPYPINLFCLTSFDTARVYVEQGAALFAQRRNIGWWPWELPVWPADWRAAIDLVDGIWAAAEFTRSMYDDAARRAAGLPGKAVPVTLMPLPASVVRVKRMTRRTLGLPAKKFLFLYVFDFNSYLLRKNPFAALDAFRKAFPATDDGVALVLKTMNSDPNNREWRRFLRECARDARIVVIDKTMDRGEVLGLIESCDAYVSLHRSEGFGRTLAEAMLFGKPVVATDFSGNRDFLTPETGFPVKWKRRAVKAGEYPFVTDADKAWWAEPSIDDAARQMRAARKAAADKNFGAKVKRFAEAQFSPARIGKIMRERLSAAFELISCEAGSEQ